MTNLVKPEPTAALEHTPKEEPQSIMAVIARAAADPRVDVTKMQALLDMQLKIEARQAEVEFNAALARLMPKLPRIQKDGTIFNKDGKTIRSRYARYEDIDLVVRPLLAEEGFSISFNTDDSVPGKLRVTGTLSHRMGHSRPTTIPLPIEGQFMSGAQAVGSTVSFGKRYCVIDLLNLITVGEDNDAQGDPSTVSEEQAMTIETLLQDTKADRKKFLAWAGVSSVAEILARNYGTVVKALEARKRQ